MNVPTLPVLSIGYQNPFQKFPVPRIEADDYILPQIREHDKVAPNKLLGVTRAIYK